MKKDSSYALNQVSVTAEVAMRNLTQAEAALDWPNFESLSAYELKTVIKYAKWRIDHAMRSVNRMDEHAAKELKEIRDESQTEGLPSYTNAKPST